MYILGISAFYHDSAAVLLKDGRIAAAAQEERFSRIKNDSGYPREAIAFCLRHAGIDIKDVAYVVFYEKTLLKFDRLLETYLALAPNCWSSFSHAIPLWLHEKLFIKRKILRELGREFSGKIVFPSHHESHAASAFFPSPFERAAILTVDGVGEWATASIGQGSGNQIRLLEELAFPHSVGLLYSAFTYFTGFRVNSGEYKLMGLAPYGRGRFADLIREKLVRIFPDGSIRLNMEYFDFCGGLTMTNRKFAALFGGPPRRPETPITQREMDLAASIQIVTEEIILNMAHHARELTGERNLVMAGGVALNCVCNGKLRESGMFDDIWIQPAAGDAGGALGAAMFLHYQLLEKERPVSGHDAQQGSFLGPEYTKEQIAAAIRQAGAEAVFYENEADWLHRTAEELASGNVVGWFQGRMEFGPRALGGRSILADPRDKAMQTRLNLKIKFRESFRPFAPSVLAERAGEIFEDGRESPYMLNVTHLRESVRLSSTAEERRIMQEAPDLIARLNVPRSSYPAITHLDYSARVQTVDADRNPVYYRLLREFERLTGCPLLVNTSFNVRGEPIVNTPEEALNCFFSTDMDVLAIGGFLLKKSKQTRPGRIAPKPTIHLD